MELDTYVNDLLKDILSELDAPYQAERRIRFARDISRFELALRLAMYYYSCYVAFWTCPECLQVRIGDERVKAGLKCGSCAGYAN